MPFPLTAAALLALAPAVLADDSPTPEELGAILDDTVQLPGAPVRVELFAVSGPGAYEVVLTNTGTGYKEKFYVQLPPHPSSATPSPMLVAFHKFGSSAKDVTVNTTFEEECYARNWWLVAPLGAATKSFASIESQTNTELVLQLVVERAGAFVDRERVYGVGFSMGGSNALNFAARRLDPGGVMFAALVNHTGAASLAYTYVNEPGNQSVLEFWYGGPPEDFPFEYARSSILDLFELPGAPAGGPTGGGGGGGVGGGGGGGGTGGGTGGGLPGNDPDLAARPHTDLARNLTHVPMRFVRGELDPLKNAVNQFDFAAEHLQRRGADVQVQIIPNVTQHLWSTLNEVATLDYLEKRSLTLPTGASTLADRDARYFWFDVEQEQAGAFTPFSWSVDVAANALELRETANLERVTVHVAEAGLDPAQPLAVLVGTVDGTSDEVVLLGYPTAPELVRRDGLATTDWVHHAPSGSLLLRELDGERHLWQVTPAAPPTAADAVSAVAAPAPSRRRR